MGTCMEVSGVKSNTNSSKSPWKYCNDKITKCIVVVQHVSSMVANQSRSKGLTIGFLLAGRIYTWCKSHEYAIVARMYSLVEAVWSGLVHVPLVVKPSSKRELFCWLVAPEILTFLHCAFSKARRVLLLSTFTQTNQLAAIGLCQMSVKVMFLRKKSEGEQNVRKPYRLYISYTLLLRRTACSNRAVSVNDGNVSQSNLPYSFTGKKSEAEQNVRKHAIKTISTVHFLHSQCVSYSWWQNNMICSKVPKTRK